MSRPKKTKIDGKKSNNVANLSTSSNNNKKTHKLTKKDRLRMIRMYATGEFTQEQLADQFGVNQSSVSSVIVNHSDSFQLYKKQFKDKIENKLSRISDRAADHALKNIKKLSPYQAITAVAIAHDKLYPKDTIKIGDNRELNITFSNFNRNSTPSTPQGEKKG